MLCTSRKSAVTIYFPDVNARLTSLIRKKQAQNKGYAFVDGAPPTGLDAYHIIFTEHPKNYNEGPKCHVISAQGIHRDIGFGELKQILKRDVSVFVPSPGESSPLLVEAGTSDENRFNFESMELEASLKEIFDDADLNISDLMSTLYNMLINVPASAGGTFPFTVFNTEYAGKIFGTKQGLIIWSTVSSATANYAIALRSISQLPDLVLTQLPNVVHKCRLELARHGFKSCNTAKILGAFFAALTVNVLSIYASFTLANQSTTDFANDANYHNKNVLTLLTISEIVGTIALVLRATMNKYVDWNLNDVSGITKTLRLAMLKKYNELLSGVNKLSDTDIDRLASGNLEKRTTRVWGLDYFYKRFWKGENPYQNEGPWQWRDMVVTAVQYGSYAMLGAVACYSVAYGILAADAVTDSFSLKEFGEFSDPYANLVALTNFTSKGMLLGASTLNLSTFVKNLLADNIIKTSTDIRPAMKAVLYGAILVFSGWNTWFSGAKINGEFSWDNLVFDITVAIGATAAINYLDTCSVFTTGIQKLSGAWYYVRGETPEIDVEAKNRLEMQKLAAMSSRDYAAQNADRYGHEITEAEIVAMRGNIQPLLVSSAGPESSKFEELAKANAVLPKVSWYTKMAALDNVAVIMGKKRPAADGQNAGFADDGADDGVAAVHSRSDTRSDTLNAAPDEYSPAANQEEIWTVAGRKLHRGSRYNPGYFQGERGSSGCPSIGGCGSGRSANRYDLSGETSAAMLQ